MRKITSVADIIFLGKTNNRYKTIIIETCNACVGQAMNSYPNDIRFDVNYKYAEDWICNWARKTGESTCERMVTYINSQWIK